MVRPVDHPPNPWRTTEVEYLEEAPPARLELFEETARSIVSGNDSPDIPFRWSVNPYRGCIHGCAYQATDTTGEPVRGLSPVARLSSPSAPPARARDASSR